MRAAFSSLTTRGRAFVAAGLAAAACSFLLGQSDLLRVALLLLALPVATAVLVTRARYLLTCTREVAPTRVQAGQSATVTLRVDNPGRVPTGLMLLEDTVPYVLGSRPRFVIDQLRPRWHREMAYGVRSDVRGRYHLGPLVVSLTDPFGFVELSRSFVHRTALIVTPVVEPLPAAPLSGDWSGTGESRPRAFAAAGTEDVMVREYRLGDDLRRIHWLSTARTDELMVRREEQPHQSRATVVLDTRRAGHRGSGPASSFEFAVSAAASVCAHLSSQGFLVRLLTDTSGAAESTWHDRGTSSVGEVEGMLDRLAVISLSGRTTFDARTHERASSGLVVAVLGAVDVGDLAALASLRNASTRAFAILLDAAAWAPGEGGPGRHQPVEEQRLLAVRNGWNVVVARPGDALPGLWRGLTGSRSEDKDFMASARSSAGQPA